ncbi:MULTISPECIES: ImmA/IrrE family metallo-endopeptidase [Dyadobacter]|jgi:Zn-dependent peptidase ImmA (M78 family)|uniref:ImmA/IrrE family metallo-endopeptidase n=1 Tax=Dyadobacter psychrotolerans TaxID=2541721 RepID=A0A4R5DGN9_9BACT|nr:ImmA/IrrE family metallo-endopeptidase [Dyadobacter psychrotolerans]TDE13192.1 ImmA/IrrE family metallo-endopeptidase [Dyadobacter psychrotolerans]
MAVTPKQAAISVLSECGIVDPAEISIEDLIAFHDGIVQEVSLTNCDGRVVMKNGRAIVSVNADIEFPYKKRFVLAHELGHMVLHRQKEATFSDDYETLEAYKRGPQETEANAFAAELLMPEVLFKEECYKKVFSPDLVRVISERFQTSITSTVYRFIDFGNHPICVFYSKDGKIKYWRKSEDFRYRISDRNKLEVPSDSVANEYYKAGRIYSSRDSAQVIYKSTWFELGKYDRDTEMFEYCIITKQYNTVLSVIWER